MFLFCLVFAMFCARLFICALWSPAGKGLTSWLSFVVSSVSLSLSHWYSGSGVVLDCIDSWSLQPYYFAIISCRKRTTNVLMRLCRLVCTLVVSKQGIRLSLDNLETTLIGLDKEFLFAWKSNYFLTHWFKLVFWVLKRTVWLRRFFWVPTTYVIGEK